MRKLIASLGVVFLVGCSTVTPVEVCQVPPKLEIVPQGSLTLPSPSATLVTPEDGEPYFVIRQEDFFLLLDNNKQLENYILECKDRNQKIMQYYEDGIKDLRDTEPSE